MYIYIYIYIYILDHVMYIWGVVVLRGAENREAEKSKLLQKTESSRGNSELGDSERFC